MVNKDLATVNKVLSIAKAEVGYLEKKSNSKLDSKTANAGSNNYTKYWRDMNASGYQAQPWCNCFVNWCFVKAYGSKKAKKLLCTPGGWSYYTPTSAGYFKSKKQWFSSPAVGDIIYFNNSKGICHVGIVYKVSNNTIYTYEGNTSGGSTVVANGGGVAAKSYPINYSRIAGFGRPKYDKAETKKVTSTVTKIIPPLAEHTLKNGSVGAEVKKLQKDLNYVMKANLKVDGEFGKNTKKALKKFQEKYNLTVDSIYGPKSESKMKKLLK